MSYVKSLRFRLMLMMTVPILIVGIAFVIVGLITSNMQVERNSNVAADASAQTIILTMQEWIAHTEAYGTIIADQPTPDFIEAINNKDHDKVIQLAKPVFDASGHSEMTFADMNGDVIARLSAQDKYGDNISKSLAVIDAIEGETVSFIYKTLNNGFSITAGVPIFDEKQNQIAVMVFMRRFDNQKTVDSLKELTGSDIVIYDKEAPVVSSLEDDSKFAAPIDESIWEAFAQGENINEIVSLGNNSAIVRYIPIHGKNDEIVGAIKAILVFESRSWITLVWAVVFALAVLIFTPLVHRNVVRTITPIRILSKQAETLATGDVSNDIEVTRTDELGILQQSMQNLTKSLRQTSDLMENISQGDFSGTHTPLSNHDVLGKSIIKMLDGNNSMLKEIRFAARQVSDDSIKIANGAQALASGSTEQAATVEELSAAISEVMTQTNHSAKLSTNANLEVQKVGELVNETNKAMSEMTVAMNHIETQSNEIQKIIKVIDDIAFRTNILALNAAVEAARAGVHGKGFAVVADEVRNLASKSAAAASDTAALIEDSVVSVKAGSELVEKVSGSMDQTATIASSSAASMENVSSVCQQASVAVAQISEGINQISKVVQENTGTADQSAVSSDKLSKQSSLLFGIVAKYKLRDE